FKFNDLRRQKSTPSFDAPPLKKRNRGFRSITLLAKMKPPLLAALSFIAGAFIAGSSTYALKAKHDAIHKQNESLIKEKIPYGSYTMMLNARLKARQAMLFFRFRENQGLSADLC